MVRTILVSGILIKLKDLVATNGRMENFMKEIGLQIKCKEREYFRTRVGIDMKENL
jgi:hypothetical protein